MLLTQHPVPLFQMLNRDQNVHGIVVQLPLPEVDVGLVVQQAIDSVGHVDCENSQFNGNIPTGEAVLQCITVGGPWDLARLVVSWNCLIVMGLLCSTSASLLWVPL